MLNQSSKKIQNLIYEKSSSPIDKTDNSSPPLFDSLSKEQRNEAICLANSLDISNLENILTFGANIQKELKHFNHNLFVHVQRHNTSSIREALFQLQKQLEKMDTDQLVNKKDNLFTKLFKRNRKSTQTVISEYHRLSKMIDRISIQLQHAQNKLINDSKMLDNIYEQNKRYFEKLNVYIVAGEIKKEQLIKKELEHLNEKKKEANHPIEMQQLQDVENAIEWLDRRIYDMEISREIAIQTAPQIRMIQQTNHLLIEKIQTSIMTTIPLWQSQISTIVNLNKQNRLQVETKQLDQQLTNGLQVTSNDLNKNIEQLKETQNTLIESIEEALVVQTENNNQQNRFEQTMEQLTNDIKK